VGKKSYCCVGVDGIAALIIFGEASPFNKTQSTGI
jgi:hypothetical protein